MEQRLQLALRFWIELISHFRPLRDDSRQEVMLIGEPGDAEAILLCAFGDARPIDVRSDVGVSDLVEGRIEMLMLRPHLDGSWKFMVYVSVIDNQHVAANKIA